MSTTMAPRTDAPLVSCLLFTFNFERFVEEAIASILDQDYPRDRLELLAFDNGSTDGTVRLLRAYDDEFEIHELGPGGSVNEMVSTALSQARGDYIAMISGDDVWPRGRLSHMVDWLERRPDVALLHGDMELIDADSRTIAPSHVAATGNRPPAGHYLGHLLKVNVISSPSTMLRGSYARLVAPIPAEAAWEDWWIATCISRVAPIGFTPEVTCRYRRHGANLSATRTLDKRRWNLQQELRFQSWLLRTVSRGDAELDPLERAVGGLRYRMRELAESGAPAPEAPLERRTHARRLCDSAAAMADPVDAVFALARAIGHDPHCERALELFARALGDARAAARHVPAARTEPDMVLDDVRDRVVLASADELCAEPGLLRDYTHGVSADDPTTLVICALGWDEARVAAEVGRAVVAAGADGPDAPDMVAVALPDTLGVRSALTLRADAVLTGSEPAWPFAGLPRYAA
jgi:hypothetical protein